MSIKRTIITTIVALALVATVAPGSASAVTIEELLAQIAQLQVQLTALQGGTGSTPVPTGNVACAGVTFTRNLTVGSTGQDVKCLQVLLNTNGYTLAASGAGSPGMETTYFGSRTLAVVKQFQAAKGWTPANQVGPLTRAALNALLGTTNNNGNTTNPTGPVSAALSFDNPMAGSLINSQAQADLLHVNFTGSGVVTSLTLTRSGISDQNTLSNVYLYDGTTRLTDGYAFNVGGTLTMNGLNIPVNGSHVISVKADTASTATSSASIAVALTGYTANGVTASSNVQGNTFAIVAGTGATAYMTTNTYNGETPSVNAGTSQYSMWSDGIQVNTRSLQLKGVNFKMIGSAPINALANVRLYVDGVDAGVAATVVSIQGSNYQSFVFPTPVTLTTGTHTIEVRADIVSGAYRSMQLSIQQASDMTLYDSQLGVNIAVAASSTTAFSADAGRNVSILQGSSVVQVDSAFSAQTNITAGSTNATIGKFTIYGYGEDVKVNSLYVTPLLYSVTSASLTNTCNTGADGAWSSGTCGLNNVTVYFNGTQVSTQKNWTMSSASNSSAVGDGTLAAATGIEFPMGSQMVIPAGQTSTIEIRADLQNASNYNYTDGSVAVALMGDTDNALGQSSSYSIGVPPTSDVATTGLTISTGSLAVAANAAYGAQTIAPNTVGAKIGSYTIQNQSTSESVRLTSLTVALYDSTGSTQMTSSTTPATTNLSALRITGTSNTTTVQPTGSDVFTVNDTLSPGAAITVDVYANLGSTTSTNFNTKLTVAGLGATSNTAVYANGNTSATAVTGQVITLGAGSIASANVTLYTSPTVSTPASFVQGGSGVGSKGTFNLVATNGPVTISELKFYVSDNSTAGYSSVTGISVNGGTAVAPVAGIAHVTGLNLTVPTGQGLDLPVTITYAGVGTGQPINPGTSARVFLAYIKYSTGSSTTTLCATNYSSVCTGGTALNSGAGIVAPSSGYIYLTSSVPTVTVASSGATLNTTTTGQTDAAKVTVTAGTNALRLRQIQFNVATSGYSTTSPVYDVTTGTSTSSYNYLAINGTAVAQCSAGTSTLGAATITCVFTNDGLHHAANNATYTGYASDYTIPANNSVTFDLFTKFSTAPGIGTATINQNVTLAKTTATDTTTTTSGGFLWDDTSTSGGTGYGPYNDYRLSGFPTTSASTHN